MGDRTNLIASFEVDSLFPTDITFTLSQFASRLTLFAIVTIIENAVVLDFIRGKSMSYLSILETAKKWGISKRRIQVLCSENRIPGAMRIGNYWAIPEDAEKPKDARVKSGRYIKKQSEEEEQV